MVSKKKILFLCSNMEVGGFQKSLVSLLQCFDYDKYDVDLLLFNPKGIFMDLIPEQVNLLPPVVDPEYMMPGSRAVWAMLKKGKLGKAAIRAISCLAWAFSKGIGAVIMTKGIPALKKHYDTTIDYNGQQLLYYMVDKSHCENRISYFHNDYIKWPFYVVSDRWYYRKVNAIVTVSDECVQSMKKVFPEYADKIYCIENINSEKTVNLFPLNSNNFQDNFTGIRLVSVGRICSDKGFDFAVEALRKLIDYGYHVHWYFVGPVTDKRFCDNILDKYQIWEHLTLLGSTNNPYDYMRNADIIVHPSRFEGKAVAVEEAKILGRPIVATNYSTVANQIDNERTGLIVEMNGESVFQGIRRLIDDPVLYQKIINIQEKECLGNEKEVEKLYRLIER